MKNNKNYILIKCFVLLLVVFIFNVKKSEAADVYFMYDGGRLMEVVVGYNFMLKVKGVTENPIWRSSNEEIVTVNESGEVTPVEVGSARITAQTGNKKYSILIEVFESDKNRAGKKIDAEEPGRPYTVPYGARQTASKAWVKRNIKMKVVRVSPKGIKLRFINKGNKYYVYTEVFRLKKWKDGKWRKVKFKERVGFSKGLNVLKINGNDVKEVKWKQYFDDYLTKGKYKIGWQNMRGKVFKSVVFRVE